MSPKAPNRDNRVSDARYEHPLLNIAMISWVKLPLRFACSAHVHLLHLLLTLTGSVVSLPFIIPSVFLLSVVNTLFHRLGIYYLSSKKTV